MGARCTECRKSTGDFRFFCPSCLYPFGIVKWDPNRGRAGYESDSRKFDRERVAIEKIETEREALRKQDLLLEQEWIEWRKLSKEEQRGLWLSRRSAPERQQYGVSAEGAERLVAQWLDYLGEEQVTVTQFRGDGGIDVRTNSFCCQVKNYDKIPVSAAEVREVFGVATAEDLAAMIFTSSSLTQDATDFCEKNNIVAIRYSAQESRLEALSSQGRRLLKAGEYTEAVDRNSCICFFCETVYPPNTHSCDPCNEYKGIMSITDWEAENGRKIR